MKLFNWINIRLFLMFALVIFLYSFTSNRNTIRKLTKTAVLFVGENPLFITQEAVNKLLIENKEDIKSIDKVNLDLNKLEKNLNSHEMIEKSEVFLSIDGVLKTVVKQKTPIARFYDQEGSFYIDYKGTKMPLSRNFTARVPLVSGDLNKQNSQKLTELFRLMYDDDFLKKNIIAVQIMPNGSLILFNRNYNYQIDFGRLTRMKAKLNNYKVFFQRAALDNKLHNYKKIDLRFSQQVVGTKN